MKLKWVYLVLFSMLAGALYALSACGSTVGEFDWDKETAGPTHPDNHLESWDCLQCHETAFLNAPGQPHDDLYAAPEGCTTCHGTGRWFNEPFGPSAHNWGQDCQGCHPDQHGKTWEDNNMCLVCHQGNSGAPTYPLTHDPSWNCYLCHAKNFRGAPQEPHGHQYEAPDQCISCHRPGDWVNDGSGRHAHNRDQNCFDCHGSDKHGVEWQAKKQCLVCHQ